MFPDILEVFIDGRDDIVWLLINIAGFYTVWLIVESLAGIEIGFRSKKTNKWAESHLVDLCTAKLSQTLA